ncbi:MAG TPA: hypothetical protein VGB73_02760 [Pyrinomonadaceae bacterium]|jgi:MFS family permease
MFDVTRTSFAPQRAAQAASAFVANDADLDARLRWLVAFHAEDERSRTLFRDARERDEMELMRRPYASARAYKLLGFLLGTLPPAAIFYRLFFDRHIGTSEAFAALIAVCFIMNAICALMGGWLGGRIGRCVDKLERRAWPLTIFASLLLGVCWALATGAAGGLIFFGIGAFFGATFALPVGALGFALFTILHRLMARGGMIDARHFWPLACGVASALSAFILGLR